MLPSKAQRCPARPSKASPSGSLGATSDYQTPDALGPDRQAASNHRPPEIASSVSRFQWALNHPHALPGQVRVFELLPSLGHLNGPRAPGPSLRHRGKLY